jgi:hypothetical protein
MPIGLYNSPSISQWLDFVKVFLVHSEDEATHLLHPNTVLSLRLLNLKANLLTANLKLTKCKFFAKEVEFLCHRVSADRRTGFAWTQVKSLPSWSGQDIHQFQV